ncbi:MAG TPA: penicillin-binding protein 2 [Acidimicrobiales bacterium]
MATDSPSMRLGVLGIAAASLMLALFGRLWYLQMVEAPSLERVAVTNNARTVLIPAMRGKILDREGRILADNRRSLTVTVDRGLITGKKNAAFRKALFERLAGVVGTYPDLLEKRFASDQYDPFLPLPIAEDVDESMAVFIKERREDYPGVEVEESWQRVYRFAPIASHVLGYVGKIPSDAKDDYLAKGYRLADTVGRAGIEQTFEEDLRGQPGFLKLEVDARNRVVSVIDRQDPVPGRDVVLTLDLKLQQYAEQLLEAGLAEARMTSPRHKPDVFYPAPAGAVVVENPNNGEIVAMATNPTYDNRWFVGGIATDKFKQLFPDGERSPLVNRAVAGRYQIGSTAKLFTSSAALNSGLLPNGNVTITDRDGMYVLPDCVPGQKCVYRNAGGASYGVTNLPKALAVSSDVYFYRLGTELLLQKGPALQEELRKYGFGSKTGVDLPTEYAGIVPDKQVKADLAKKGVISKDEGRGYFVGDNLQVAIGQGLFTVTPLQLVNGYSTFANGGARWRPTIATTIIQPGTPEKSTGVVDLSLAQVERRILPQKVGEVLMAPDHRQAIMDGLVGVIKDGTGKNTFADYDYKRYPIAGKTGTSQDALQVAEHDTSLFVGFGPLAVDAPPQYTIGAVLEKAGYGAWSAAPVVKCLFEAISGQQPIAEPLPADNPFDKTARVAATLPPLADTACLKVPKAGVDY